jgi:hypothetical protein
MSFAFLHDFEQSLAEDIPGAQPREFLEGGIYRQKSEVDRLTGLITDDFMQSETAQQFLEKLLVLLFAVE